MIFNGASWDQFHKIVRCTQSVAKSKNLVSLIAANIDEDGAASCPKRS